MATQQQQTDRLSERLAAVHARIAAAVQQAGRNPGDVKLLGVTKTHAPEVIRAAYAAGLRDFGENRVQEAESKINALADLRPDANWHLIGHLQRNKARRAVALFDMVHSVDSVALAQALDRHAAETRRQGDKETRRQGDNILAESSPLLHSSAPLLPILIQVNVSGEASKAGFDLVGWERERAVLAPFLAEVEQILALPQLDVQGLMAIAPWSDDPRVVQPVFRSVRLLRDELARTFPRSAWPHLSMGMTDDFEWAIAEGATMVRIGRAIFGERS